MFFIFFFFFIIFKNWIDPSCMRKNKIPAFYILVMRLKIRALDMIHDPRLIKRRIMKMKRNVTNFCKKFSLGNACKKLYDSSLTHLFFSWFFWFMGAAFFGFVVYEYNSYKTLVMHFSHLYIYLVPIFMSLFFFLVGAAIAMDAYANWLIKIYRIDYDYDYPTIMAARRERYKSWKH